ncbi:class I SAM-dependent methyltransferase [Streptomyces sp. NBC_00335]|uniref:class I SAM-dependent methyltransferase n=1 Tax=unclassified Streptomyces TaxID=2593676 RepID=UPI00225648B7|nr:MULTISPECIES: class I SAM-dependent methyltransferase [unclassified Streptomyces]MCX5407497.1 class I SAM-dependent methyltransferase [Streptomyces sp. NBC_00086]
MSIDTVIGAWNAADPSAIHPARGISEDAYRESGQVQAELLASVLPAGCRVVDFGCGDGRVALPLVELGFDVIGADGSQAMLDRLATSAPDVPTVLTDGIDLGTQIGKKADAVVSLAVLIHHSYESAERIIAGLRAAVRVNGLLVLDWPTSDDPREGGGWISVTTWSRLRQDEICQRIGLKRLDSDLPWGVFRAVKAG